MIAKAKKYKKYLVYISLFIIVSTTVLFISTIKQGHNWGGDFALYISHAINIATGDDYNNTGYLYNPNSAWFGPESYPPIFPLILSGVYKLYGLNIYAMKIAIIICFIIFLVFYCLYCDKRLNSDTAKISSLLMIAFSPLYWDIKNSVLSDIPFIMFFYLSLLISDKVDTIQRTGGRAVAGGLIFGVISYLAYGTRGVGLLIIVAYCVNQIYNRRGITTALCCSIIVFSSLFIWQVSFLHSDISYMESINEDINKSGTANIPDFVDRLYMYFQYVVKNVSNNVPQYTMAMKWYWEAGSTTLIGIFMTVVTMIAAGYGFIKTIRKRVTTAEIFFIIYITVLIFGPFFQGMRYLLPIFPMYALFIFRAADIDKDNGNKVTAQYLNIGIIISIMIITITNYTRLDYSPYEYGVEKQSSLEMFEYIREKTPKKSLIIFQKPRVMALYTGRKSSTYFYSYDGYFNGDKAEEYFEKINATHVVISNGVWGVEELKGFVKWAKADNVFMEEKYRNEDFILFKILGN